jgi:hypothetical protein
VEWKNLETQSDIDELMQSLDNFHDSCIKDLKYTSGTYVDEDFSMIMNTDPVVNLFIQRQSEFMTTIEFCLEGVSQFHINNSLDSTLEIFEASFFEKEGNFYWHSSDDIEDESATSFVCKKIKWRELS